MKIIFAGTPEFASAHLQALIDAKHNIAAVYTQPDRPSGRGKKFNYSAVKNVALAHGLPIEQAENFKSEENVRTLASYQADVMVVVAYGLILPKAVLDLPKIACLNVHGSLLPRWRGAAPIQRALWAGDSQTGIAIMHMDVGLDTGDVLLEKSIPIESNDTSASLYAKLAELGPLALLEALDNIHSLSPVKQDDAHATYAKKLSKAEAKCDWHLSCSQLDRNVRAFNPWPVAWFEHKGQNIKIFHATAIPLEHNRKPGEVITYSKDGLDIACDDGLLRIYELQLPNKKRQSVEHVVNGHPHLFQAGEQL